MLAAALLMATTGCTPRGSLRATINVDLNVPEPYTLQAVGYPAADGRLDHASYYGLGINLVAAAPFAFSFPDGFVADSRHISAETLAAHLAPLETDDQGARVSRRSFLRGAGRYSIVFTVASGAMATHLWLYACQSVQPDVLGTPDHDRWFSFPVTHEGLQMLFGGPLRVGHDFTILGRACD